MAEGITKSTLKSVMREVLDERTPGAVQMKALGGFMQFFKEGGDLYTAQADAIKNTGLLIKRLVGDEAGPGGLIADMARLSEGSFKYFGQIDQGLESFRALTENMSSFSHIARETRQELVDQGALFKELGVSMSDFSEILDSARIGFQMTGKDAAALSREVAGIGNATGVGMGKAMANFRSAQSSMAYDSRRLMENFKDLQTTAAQTGIGFDKLTSAFGESMDTFEGSASKAGTLNAILGRSVFNSIELLGQTEAERVNTIVKGIRESVDVQALSRNKFQLKAVASGLGLSVDETRKLLSGQMSVDEALAQKGKLDPREKAFKKMAEMLNEDVNPELSAFAKQLEQLRTAQTNAMIEYNREARKRIGQFTEISPLELYNQLQDVVRGVTERGVTGAGQEVLDRINDTFSTEGMKDLVKEFSGLKSAEDRMNFAKNKMKDLTSNLAALKSSIASPQDVALTAATQEKRKNMIDASLAQDPSLAFTKLINLLSGGLTDAADAVIPGIPNSPNLFSGAANQVNLVLKIGEQSFKVLGTAMLEALGVETKVKTK